MTAMSILAKPSIDVWLKQAKSNLEQDGYLATVLFVKSVSEQLVMVDSALLMLAQNPQQRQLMISAIGKRLVDEIGEISEAVILLDTWTVMKPGGLNIPISQDPRRQEAITVSGRDARNTRTTSVVQPFLRDDHNRPVWGKIPIAVYNEPTKNNPTSIGLLDHLFFYTGKTN